MRHGMMFGVAALLLAGCEIKQQAPSGEEASTSTRTRLSQAEAERIAGEMHKSFTSGDAFKIMEHYAARAVMFDPTHGEASSDRAVQTRWAAEFVTMKPSDLVTSSRQVQVLDNDTFVASGIAAFLADVGGNRRRLSVRYSQVFQRQPDGAWKIVHEHMSLPPGPAGPGA